MDVTFLIGNGFDIGVGLPSKFVDFFPVYEKNSKGKSDEIQELAKNIEGNYETWADFEAALGEYTAQFTLDQKKKIEKQVEDFLIDFGKYLKNQERNIRYKNKQDIANKMKKAIKDFYLSLQREAAKDIQNILSAYGAGAITYNFLSFNYTSILEGCLNTIPDKIVATRKLNNQLINDKVGEVVHVHGTYDDSPVLGVGDANQIVNDEFAEDSWFKDRFVKPTLYKRLKNGNDSDALSVINKSAIVCIYGMSLGKTDIFWWKALMVWLAKDRGRRLIVFRYDDKFSPASTLDRLDIEDSIIKKLDDFRDNKHVPMDSLKDRIYIAVSDNIFAMDLRRNELEEQQEVMQRALELAGSYKLPSEEMIKVVDDVIARQTALEKVKKNPKRNKDLVDSSGNKVEGNN